MLRSDAVAAGVVYRMRRALHDGRCARATVHHTDCAMRIPWPIRAHAYHSAAIEGYYCAPDPQVKWQSDWGRTYTVHESQIEQSPTFVANEFNFYTESTGFEGYSVAMPRNGSAFRQCHEHPCLTTFEAVLAQC